MTEEYLRELENNWRGSYAKDLAIRDLIAEVRRLRAGLESLKRPAVAHASLEYRNSVIDSILEAK